MKTAEIHSTQTGRDRSEPTKEDFVKFLSGDHTTTTNARKAWKHIEPKLGHVLDDFYCLVATVPELKDKLGTSPDKVAGLKGAQTRHWHYILNNETDLEFEGQSVRIGEAHVRTDLSVQWYVASYGRILQQIVPAILSKNKLSPENASRQLQATISRFFIDMVLSIGAFNGNIRQLQDLKKKEDEDLQRLRNLAMSVSDINRISMDMALLSRNTKTATESGQAISAAVAELVASIEQIAENSGNTAQSADRATESVSDGLGAMQSVLTAMTDIADTSKHTETSLNDLMQASEQIGEFLAVIESISNQTNLLALNATIEAARAGEAGKGFAVVAAEVKELAAHSNKAAEDISKRIQSLNEGIHTIQASISSSLDAIETGQESIRGANDLMSQIRSEVGEVSGAMQEVSTILHQQNQASHEIAESVAGVANLSSENEQTLASMVLSLQESNDKFSDSAKEWFEANSHRSLCEMAKIDHVLFKKRVVDTIMGRADWHHNDVPDHHNCRLGKWYDSIRNPEICNHAIFTDLVAPHEIVHAAARKALECHARGDSMAAFEALKEMDLASNEVLAGLEQLSQILANELRHADKRQFARHQSSGKARIESDKGAMDVEITDISKSGMGVTGMPKDVVGRTVRVTHGDEIKVAEAMWSDGKKGGVRFVG